MGDRTEGSRHTPVPYPKPANGYGYHPGYNRSAYPHNGNAPPAKQYSGSARVHTTRAYDDLQPYNSRQANDAAQQGNGNGDRFRAAGGKRRFAEEPRGQSGVVLPTIIAAQPGGRSPPSLMPVTQQPAQQYSQDMQQQAHRTHWGHSQGQDGGGRQSSDPYLAYYSRRADNNAFAQQWPQTGAIGPLPPPSSHQGPAPSANIGLAIASAAPPLHPSAFVDDERAGSLESLGSRTSSQGPVFTRLTQNITAFVKQLDPKPEALNHRRRVLQAVSQAVSHAFPEYPHARVRAFGSFVSGLGTEQSDMDLVITGIQEPPADTGFYPQHQRAQIARLLDRVSSALYRSTELRSQIQRSFIIRSSRIPIAKVTLHSGLVIDLSIAGEGGPAAAAYLAQQVTAWAALRPLTLTVKAYLKSQHVNDVSTGGLSSYGITFMVLAHLQEEFKVGSDTKDLGYMLFRFFKRFGSSYDQCTYCVAVGLGGVVTRWQALNSGAEFFKNDDRLATVDPLTGRDCTEGCFETPRVMMALTSAERYLSSAIAKYKNHTAAQLARLDLLEGLVSAVSFDDDEHEDDRAGPRKRR